MRPRCNWPIVAMMFVTTGCGSRTANPDYTAVVEVICADFCEMNLSCHAPPLFASAEECEDACFDRSFILNASPCGEATRDLMACIGATATCAEYNDTNNVYADDYTCKHEKTTLIELECAQTGEEPHP